jgi:hypothetical protein
MHKIGRFTAPFSSVTAAIRAHTLPVATAGTFYSGQEKRDRCKNSATRLRQDELAAKPLGDYVLISQFYFRSGAVTIDAEANRGVFAAVSKNLESWPNHISPARGHCRHRSIAVAIP